MASDQQENKSNKHVRLPKRPMSKESLLKEAKVVKAVATKYTPQPAALDTQVGGKHYKGFKIQPVEFFYANNLDSFQANVIKYVMRYKDKNGKQDLLKAKHYIDLLIECMDKYPDEEK